MEKLNMCQKGRIMPKITCTFLLSELKATEQQQKTETKAFLSIRAYNKARYVLVIRPHKKWEIRISIFFVLMSMYASLMEKVICLEIPFGY